MAWVKTPNYGKEAKISVKIFWILVVKTVKHSHNADKMTMYRNQTVNFHFKSL